MSNTGIGKRVKRKEDRRFLTGKGRYTDDINLPRQAFAHFVRSPHACAKINGIDASEALSQDGVLGVYTGADWVADQLGGLPCGWLVKSKNGADQVEPPHLPLAPEVARHVGDPVAVVIARTKELAKEAASMVEVDYDDMPASGTLAKAITPDAPQVWPDASGNVSFDWEVGDEAAQQAAFAEADRIVEIEVTNNRVIPNAMEPRAAVASYDPNADSYTLYTTSQNPHLIRLLLSAFVMQIPEHKLQVIAPDVGGGFGSKIYPYSEEVVCTWTSKKVGVPVKWTADRSEAFMSDAHGRGHITKAQMAVKNDGTMLAFRVETYADLGAYLSTFATATPTYLYAPLLCGIYKMKAVYANVKGIFTHTVPVDAYRGAGRPEATYLVERMVDKVAGELGIDRIELRRKNMIQKDEFPYQTPLIFQFDTGDFEACLDTALEAIDFAGFEARRAEAASRGMLRGIGVSTYVEACGLAPSAAAGALGARAGLYESAIIRVHPTGSVTVFTGTHSHGQGHETAFAQIVAEKLGMEVDNITVEHGDTEKISFGMGSYGSRSLAVGGSAISKATDKVIEKGRKIAAHLLEASADDIDFEGGEYKVKGTDKVLPFGAVAFTAYVPHNYPHEELEPGLEESAFYDPANFTFPGGCHITEVEIDPETGVVKVVDVAAADDIGTVINPMIVDGQVHGGLVQGIGQALYEEAVYDDDGQLKSGTYMNYTMPRAADFPMFKVGFHVTACTHNPLGSKGVGEVGSIGVPPSVINAVLDALKPTGVTDISMPATAQKVWRAIQEAKAAQAAE